MPYYASSHGADANNGSQNYIWFEPPKWRRDGTRRAALWFRGGASSTYMTDAVAGSFLQMFAERGIGILSIQNGTIPQFGNATALANIDKAWTLLKGTFGAKTDKVILIGGSRGFCDADNWMRANLSSVACCVGMWPGTDMNDLHDNNRGGATALIETAYTNLAGWNAAKATKDPVTNAASVAAVPGKIYYATDDNVCLPATAAAYAAAAGANWSLSSLGAVGHVASYPDWDDIVSFVRPYV